MIESILRIVALIVLGVLVGIEWGPLNGVAAMAAVWLLMPFLPSK